MTWFGRKLLRLRTIGFRYYSTFLISLPDQLLHIATIIHFWWDACWLGCYWECIRPSNHSNDWQSKTCFITFSCDVHWGCTKIREIWKSDEKFCHAGFGEICQKWSNASLAGAKIWCSLTKFSEMMPISRFAQKAKYLGPTEIVHDKCLYSWHEIVACCWNCDLKMCCYIHCVSEKMHQLWNSTAQTYKDRFWWYLAEIFKILYNRVCMLQFCFRVGLLFLSTFRLSNRTPKIRQILMLYQANSPTLMRCGAHFFTKHIHKLTIFGTRNLQTTKHNTLINELLLMQFYLFNIRPKLHHQKKWRKSRITQFRTFSTSPAAADAVLRPTFIQKLL